MRSFWRAGESIESAIWPSLTANPPSDLDLLCFWLALARLVLFVASQAQKALVGVAGVSHCWFERQSSMQ